MLCQEINKSLILTYSVKNTDFVKDYYWIIPDSSIQKKGFHRAFPLYLDFFSNDKLINCIKKEPVDLFTATVNSDYDFNKDYENAIENLRKIIKDNKLVVQQIIKKKNKKALRPREKITVSITPIEGNFAYCPAGDKMSSKIKYNGKIPATARLP